MPRKGSIDLTKKWLTFDIEPADHAVLENAAKNDGRPLKDYLKQVLAAHVAMLRTLGNDNKLKKQLAALSDFPPEDQARILERVRERFRQEGVSAQPAEGVKP